MVRSSVCVVSRHATPDQTTPCDLFHVTPPHDTLTQEPIVIGCVSLHIASDVLLRAGALATIVAALPPYLVLAFAFTVGCLAASSQTHLLRRLRRVLRRFRASSPLFDRQASQRARGTGLLRLHLQRATGRVQERQ